MPKRVDFLSTTLDGQQVILTVGVKDGEGNGRYSTEGGCVMRKATLWLTMFLAVAVGGCGGREPEAWEALLEEAVEWKALCERASKKAPPGTGMAEAAEEWRSGLETASKAAKENPGAAEEWKTLLEESKELRVVMERLLKASEEGDVEAIRKVRRETIEIWEEAKRSSEKTEEEFFRELNPPGGE